MHMLVFIYFFNNIDNSGRQWEKFLLEVIAEFLFILGIQKILLDYFWWVLEFIASDTFSTTRAIPVLYIN